MPQRLDCTNMQGFGSRCRCNMLFTMLNYLKAFIFAIKIPLNRFNKHPVSGIRPLLNRIPETTHLKRLSKKHAFLSRLVSDQGHALDHWHLLSESTLDASKARSIL